VHAHVALLIERFGHHTVSEKARLLSFSLITSRVDTD